MFDFTNYRDLDAFYMIDYLYARWRERDACGYLYAYGQGERQLYGRAFDDVAGAEAQCDIHERKRDKGV